MNCIFNHPEGTTTERFKKRQPIPLLETKRRENLKKR
jgi:hypothetical protein